MNNLTGNSASEKLILYLDGELDPIQEQELFDQLAADAELQSEMNELISIRETVSNDAEAFTPPLEATQAVFNSVGISNPSSNVVSMPWFTKFGKPVAAALIASLVTTFYLVDFYETKITELENKQNFSPKVEEVSLNMIAKPLEEPTNSNFVNSVNDLRSNIVGDVEQSNDNLDISESSIISAASNNEIIAENEDNTSLVDEYSYNDISELNVEEGSINTLGRYDRSIQRDLLSASKEDNIYVPFYVAFKNSINSSSKSIAGYMPVEQLTVFGQQLSIDLGLQVGTLDIDTDYYAAQGISNPSKLAILPSVRLSYPLYSNFKVDFTTGVGYTTLTDQFMTELMGSLKYTVDLEFLSPSFVLGYETKNINANINKKKNFFLGLELGL